MNVDGVSAAPEPWAKPKSCASSGRASLTMLIVPQVLRLPKATSFCSAVTEDEERVSAITEVKQSSPPRMAVRSMPPSTNSDFVYVWSGSPESAEVNGNTAGMLPVLKIAQALTAAPGVQVPSVIGTSVCNVPLTSPPVPTHLNTPMLWVSAFWPWPWMKLTSTRMSPTACRPVRPPVSETWFLKNQKPM